MTTSLFGSRWRALLIVCISLVGIVLTVRTEQSSEARANRLHRSDQLEEALAIYLDRAVQDTAADRLHYNLGTTLLRLGSPAAFTELANASVSGDERLRTNAHYNLGLWSLIQALFAPSNDSVMAHATHAIEENKAALRLDPDQPDAVWNLALARQVFEAASPETVLGNIETPTQGPQLGEVQIVEGPPPPGLDESPGDSPSEAEEEALAEEDVEPLTLEEAGEILGTGHLNPSTMLGKLLLRESRSRRRRGFGVNGPPW